MADREHPSTVTAGSGADQESARQQRDWALTADELAAELSLVLMYLSASKEPPTRHSSSGKASASSSSINSRMRD